MQPVCTFLEHFVAHTASKCFVHVEIIILVFRSDRLVKALQSCNCVRILEIKAKLPKSFVSCPTHCSDPCYWCDWWLLVELMVQKSFGMCHLHFVVRIFFFFFFFFEQAE